MFSWSRKQEPRLENWDGRSRSTRDSSPMFSFVWNKPINARLAVVFATTAGLIALLYLNSPPFPYRLGGVLSHDFRARVAFEVRNEAFAAQQFDEHPNDVIEATSGDGKSTRESPPEDHYAAGAILVRRGAKIDGPKLVLLMAEHRAYAASLTFGNQLARALSLSVLLFLFAILLSIYVARFQPDLGGSFARVLGICILIALSVGLALTLSRPPWDAAIIPLVFTAMVLTIVTNPPFALLLSFSIAIILVSGRAPVWACCLFIAGEWRRRS